MLYLIKIMSKFYKHKDNFVVLNRILYKKHLQYAIKFVKMNLEIFF